MANYADQAGFKPAHLEAIGRITVEWSYLESVVEAGIWGFTTLDRSFGRIMTADLFIRPRLIVLTNLGHRRLGAGGRRRLDNIIKAIRDLQSQRNDIIHGNWSLSGRPDQVIRMRYRKKSKGPEGKKLGYVDREITEMSPEDLRSIADEISKISKRLRKFLQTVGFFPSP